MHKEEGARCKIEGQQVQREHPSKFLPQKLKQARIIIYCHSRIEAPHFERFHLPSEVNIHAECQPGWQVVRGVAESSLKG